MVVLHRKIQELKTKAAPINYRGLSVNEVGQLVNNYLEDLKKGIVEGYAVRWGIPNEYREIFLKGAFSKSISENGPGSGSNYEIKFLNQHNQEDPLSLFEWLKEDDYGLRFRTKKLIDFNIQDSSSAKVVRKLIDKVLNNFSIGFDYIWEQMEWDDAQEAIIMKEARLFEISVVSIPADMGTFAIRSKEAYSNLYDDTEDFIDLLPRKLRLQARQLFARHKSLIPEIGPEEKRETSPDSKNKPKRKERAKKQNGLDLDYLIKNF